MKINGWDVSEANAKQHRVTVGNHSIKSDSEWIQGSPIAVFCKNELGFKELEIVLVLREGKKEADADISKILSHLLEPAEIVLNGYDHKFFGILKKSSKKEVVLERWYNLTLLFDCYEYADEISTLFSGQTKFTVTNDGNILTPVTIEITPQIGTALIVLTGICRDTSTGADLPIRINELKTGKSVIIDSETGLVTEDGEIKADVEFWNLPTLLPGKNQITVDSNRMDITLRFHPRFM